MKPLADFHALEAFRLAWPVEWSKIYGRTVPLHIEIGFGDASYLLSLSRKEPGMNILGLEISLPSIRKAERKLDRMRPDNVRLLRARGEVALWLLCRRASIQAVTINFPDPWPKAAHEHRRLINDSFLRLVADRMVCNGHLEIATDHQPYAEWIASHLSASPYFESRHKQAYLVDSTDRSPTKYEQKARSAGQTCYYFHWYRNEKATGELYPQPMELSMPHVNLAIPLTLDQLGQMKTPQEWAGDATTVKVTEVFRSTCHDKLVFDTYVREQVWEQRILLGLVKRADGSFLLHLHDVGFPRPTRGIHLAVRCLAQHILTMHPGATILRHNLPADMTIA